VLGLLYDIHGNLPALEAVLAEAEREGVDRWLLGGDYGTPSPWPLETLGRLRELGSTTWIRGNGERWLREPPTDRPEVMQDYARSSSATSRTRRSTGSTRCPR
jgi:predicted phosphodiesterase